MKKVKKELIVIIIVAAFMFPTSAFVYAEEFDKNIDAITQQTVGFLGYGVKLSCDDPYYNATNGEEATFVVKIENTGTLDDTYEITASSIEDIVCKVNGVKDNPYILPLDAGESITFEVTAEIGESVPTGEWIIVVSAYSQNDPTVHDELYLTVNVNNGYGVKLSCDDPSKNANAGDVIKFIVKIENTGTLDDTYEITASSIEDIVCKVNGVKDNPYILPLDAGESITFEVTAEIGESVSIGEWIIVVSAYSQNDPTVHDELYLTVNVKKIRNDADSPNVKYLYNRLIDKFPLLKQTLSLFLILEKLLSLQ